MSGRSGLNLANNAAAVVGNVALNLVLIPRFGIVGAAVSWAVAIVGVNRTLTAWLAPTPARANGVPDTTLNGAATDAVPDTVPPAVFVRVTVCSAKLPRLTLPKFSGPVGLKANSARATALTSVEQALSRPEASTALTAAR